MYRPQKLILVLLLLVLAPGVVQAQKDSRYTREAEKYLGLAMTRADAAERTELYQQALTHLREGMQEDADNAKVWLMSGTVLAALGQMTEADQAFRKAVELHPEYEAEVSAEREAAWVEAFNQGVVAMDEGRTTDAIAALENAQLIYDQRPEALMNLGALYSNTGEAEKAEQAFLGAIEASQSPLFAQLDSTQQAEWVRYRDMAKLNIAQMFGLIGVEAFQEQRFEEARQHFMKASEANPYSRDYLFNQAQSLWAMSSALEEGLDEKPEAEQAQIRSQLQPLYEQADAIVKKTRELDPNNEILFLIEAQSHRMRSRFASDSAAVQMHQNAALTALRAHSELPVYIDQVTAFPDADGSTVINGTMTNNKAEEGAAVTIEFTLVDLTGATVGQHSVTVQAPAAEQATAFELRVMPTGEVAGWRYVVK